MPLFGGNKEQEKKGAGKEEEKERAGESLAEKLLQSLGIAEPPKQAGQGIINGVDFQKLIQYVIGERAEAKVEEDIPEVREILEETSALSRDYVDTFVRDGLGRIVHPVYGGSVIDSRLAEVALLLRESIRRLWRSVIDAIRAKEPPEEVYKRARLAENFTKRAYVLLVEMYAKLVTLYYINAPPRARPPLTNSALGYEIVD